MNTVKHNHVQISKFLMKPFSHRTQDGDKVFYLDYKSGDIREEKISTLGTSPEYYYPAMEEFLAEEIESKVGEIFSLFRKIAKKESTLTISKADNENIKNFFAFCLLRSEGIKLKTKEKSLFLQFLPEKDQVALILSQHKISTKYFAENFFSSILLNKSSVDFVIPHNCIYSISSIGKLQNEKFDFLCLPISPRCCALLIPNSYMHKYVSDTEINGLYISDDEMIRGFNNRAFASENTFSKKFIIGSTSELERLSLSLRSPS